MLAKHPHRRGEDYPNPVLARCKSETPPQAWGRLAFSGEATAEQGNTPTGVGKTRGAPGKKLLEWKHPHRRGEDRSLECWNAATMETPPQAWGRLALFRIEIFVIGNTPTGVGKTHRPWPWSRCRQKHPHRRGEDSVAVMRSHTPVETPPQAWGRHFFFLAVFNYDGNTPTGVGKTILGRSAVYSTRKHPHRRGEDTAHFVKERLIAETPPQAWGRPRSRLLLLPMPRNTPTGVGKTS